jgi:hypothetical protein
MNVSPGDVSRIIVYCSRKILYVTVNRYNLLTVLVYDLNQKIVSEKQSYSASKYCGM